MICLIYRSMSSQDKEEKDEYKQFHHNDEPKVAMVWCGQQMLHLVVSINHVTLSFVNVFSQFLDANILRLDFWVEVLCSVFCGLDDSNDLVKLIILTSDHILLVLQYLTIVHIASLVELSILSSFVAGLFGCCGKCCLIGLNWSILSCKLSIDSLLKLVDCSNAFVDLFFGDSRVFVGLILIVVQQLLKVADISL